MRALSSWKRASYSPGSKRKAALYMVLFRSAAPRRLQAEADAEAVPRIHAGDGQGQIDQSLVVELFAHLGVHVVRRLRLRQQGQRFGPGQCGAFARIVESGFAPDAEAVQALLAFARRARFAQMQVDAVGAAVDLRDADLDEQAQLRIEPAALQIGTHVGERLHGLGRSLAMVEAGLHGENSSTLPVRLLRQ